MANSPAINFTRRNKPPCSSKSQCKQHMNSSLQSQPAALMCFIDLFIPQGAKKDKHIEYWIIMINYFLLYFAGESALICIDVIKTHFTANESISQQVLQVCSQLVKNLFLIARDRSSPLGVHTHLWGFTLQKAEGNPGEEKSASSNPLPQTMGLLIKTITAIAPSKLMFYICSFEFRVLRW